MTRRPFLDFYGKHGISPVANDVNRATHFVQRSALYHRLGILDGCVRGRKVLEFGPGNGVNALYTISLEPDLYVLVDANPSGIENCEKNLNHFYPGKNWRIVDSLIEEYKTENKFDLVICEGLLPTQLNPGSMARQCASFVDKGGLFVLTCHDMISTVSETLRCLPGLLSIRGIKDFDEKVVKLARLFGPHLAHLKGITRTNEDWVIDNILNAEFWQNAPLFSIPEAIEALDEDFIVHTTSPSFLQDFSWYKSVRNMKSDFKTVMKEAYWKNAHSFIDWRIVSPPGCESDSQALYKLCGTIRDRVREAAENDAAIGALIESCQRLSHALPEEYAITKVALKSYIEGMGYYLNSGEIRSEKFLDFGAWWGRGMQYMSFIKE